MSQATLTHSLRPAAGYPRGAAEHTGTMPHFGQGSAEPYARALDQGKGSLTLWPLNPGDGLEPVVFNVHSWCAPATALERALLGSLDGPLLDIGCGPGRLLAASQSLGITALGLDTSAPAVQRALNRGTRAVRQSVFAPVPHAGRWRAGLLLDGNIGIGGNVSALLRRCGQILAADGTLLVETDADDSVDAAFHAVMEDDDANFSEPFRWARAGLTSLTAKAESSGWQVTTTHRIQGRVFCRLNRRPVRRSSR
ncbi:methionine biosynthesis protein MetW [Paenarthrobacter sp. PH39-S1]|uniref:methionine biosynthesis protein MetW n=1 Tax=Paenarthrobacter sp. PH39-S1 TaxID=3046204 RepID=UPI0024BA31D4|nr:methionine biosynthesis protein MetW [Paenarthrobacter sp. PH39-S1]MDJ0355818.1 methionine biosynthesis protein MetW [Paenarthrobacter sp. PH39-S1]